MRDFTNGGDIHVNGDMNVGDGNSNGNQYRRYTECDNETLRLERPYRQENDRLEQGRKLKRLSPFFAISVILFMGAATWATIRGQANLETLLIGAASVLLGWKALELALTPNALQREERAAVAEINKILRQRRAE